MTAKMFAKLLLIYAAAIAAAIFIDSLRLGWINLSTTPDFVEVMVGWAVIVIGIVAVLCFEVIWPIRRIHDSDFRKTNGS